MKPRYTRPFLDAVARIESRYPYAVVVPKRVKGLRPDGYKPSSRNDLGYIPYDDHAVWHFLTEADLREFEAALR